MTSASVTIDASVLAIPQQVGDPEEVYLYIDTILDWSKLLDEPWVAIYMSERASEALLEDGLYPFRDQLKRLFSGIGVIEYDVNTVATVVERLLQLTPFFETYFSIKDVLAENLSTEPDILKLCSGNSLRSDLARCVILIAILRRHCQQQVSGHSLILRYVPNNIVRVQAQIHALEHEREDLGTLPNQPEYFEGDVLVCKDFKGLIECLDEVEILLQAIDEIGVEIAIRIAVYKFKLANGKVPEWDDVSDCKIGHSFQTSLQQCHSKQHIASKVLRAIVESLEQTNMAATHWLRTGLGGDDPQRVRRRDQAKAWRRDIDRDHHLHYWSCEDGTVEIASVSYPHDNFIIPE